MGKVLKADGSAAEAYAAVVLAGDEPEVWVTYPLYFDAAAFAVFSTLGSGLFTAILDVTGGLLLNQVEIHDDSGPVWGTLIDGGTSTGTPVPGVWLLVELHHVRGGTSHLYVDGTLLMTGAGDAAADVRQLWAGQVLGPTVPDTVAYMRYYTVGTTRGGGDLFADDFEDGTLDAWDSTTGDVSVVDDPFPETPTFDVAPVFAVAFDDPTLEPDPTWTQVG